MHTYSTDNDDRTKIIAGIGVLAYVVGVAVEALASTLGAIIPPLSGFTVSWGISYAVLWKAYNGYVWNSKIARWLGTSKVPDFSGVWEGHLKTSYDGEIPDGALHESNDPESDMQRVAATLRINQTWRKINVHLETEQSESDSTGATILTQDGRWPSLNYQYENDPDTDSVSTMARHYGTADLALKETEEPVALDGFYYTGPDRENYGEMFFEKVSDEM